MMPTGKSCKELMSLDWQQKAGESGDKTEGTGTGAHCRTRPQESLWQVPLPHTQLSNTISSHAPQTEFDLLLKSEELSRLLLKSTRFCRISCRPPNMKKPTAIFFFTLVLMLFFCLNSSRCSGLPCQHFHKGQKLYQLPNSDAK